jgi:large subunit ribosomal protein L15
MMLQLNNLVSAGKDRKRVGRGGSRGGTSGKGHKGQKARSGGKIRIGFEGGQMPIFRRLPKRGFNNALFQSPVLTVNIGVLDQAFGDGEVVDLVSLVEKGIIKVRVSQGSRNLILKILGGGTLTKKLTIRATTFSKSANEAITRLGGVAEIIKEA